MKTKLYSLLASVLFIGTISNVFGQAKYDNFPTTLPRNADIGNQKKEGAETNFVPVGTSWANRIITYGFQNGTDDINGDDERQAIRDAFALWAAQTDLAFVEVCNFNDADIVFRWATGDHGDPVPVCFGQPEPFDGPGTVLGHNMGGPAPNNCGNQAGEIHFDDEETWTLNLRPNDSQPIDLVTVAAHEIGHGLGLAHTGVAGSLMLAFYTGSHRFLGSDDIAGIQSVYGQRNNNLIRSPNIDLNTQPICGSVVLLVNNVPNGTTLTWTSSNPSGLEIVNDVATRQNNFNGRVTVTATINSGCGTLTLTKEVNVGLPTISNVVVDNVLNPGPVSVNPNSTHYVQATSSNDPSTYSLSASTNSGNIVLNLTGINAGNCQINVSGSVGSASLNITASNGCGTNTRFVTFFIPSGFRVAPNPAKDNMTLIFDDASYQEALPDQLELVSEKEGESLQTVDIKDMFTKKSFKDGNQVVFDIRNYPRGIYYLRVTNSRQTADKKVEVIRLAFE